MHLAALRERHSHESTPLHFGERRHHNMGKVHIPDIAAADTGNLLLINKRQAELDDLG